MATPQFTSEGRPRAESSRRRDSRWTGPAVYQIRVRGRLDPRRAERFEGLNVSESVGAGEAVETILVGRMLDQAELAGVLRALFDLRVPVIALECLADG